MIIGDFWMLYAKEDPIQTLVSAGFKDVARELEGLWRIVTSLRTVGLLDYALANEKAFQRLLTGTGVGISMRDGITPGWLQLQHFLVQSTGQSLTILSESVIAHQTTICDCEFRIFVEMIDNVNVYVRFLLASQS